MTTRALALACLLSLGCGGIVDEGGDPPDAGAPEVATGCYGAEMHSCGSHVGRWCWSDPPSVAPAEGCIRYSDAGTLAYWCCPPFSQ